MTDLLPVRCLWADYFDSQGIQYAFFSAANATALQQERRDAVLSAEAQDWSSAPKNNDDQQKVNLDYDHPVEISRADSGEDSSQETSEDETYFSAEDEEVRDDLRVRILSVLELEDWFLSMAPDLSGKSLFFLSISL